jgi:hypothetical protein
MLTMANCHEVIRILVFARGLISATLSGVAMTQGQHPAANASDAGNSIATC